MIRNGSSISNNSAPAAAGIFNQVQLTIMDSAVSGNTATATSGGGIASDGFTTIVRSTISGNTDGTGQGGMYIASGTALSPARLTVDASTISGNSGGITLAFYAAATITRSTISSNNATRVGGGSSGYGITAILDSPTPNFTPSATLVNDTISGNDTAGLSAGGATTVANTTFALNGVDVSPGTFGGPTIANSILSSTSGGGPTCSGTITSGDYNIATDNACGLNGPHDITGPTIIGPLANNGGPTQTHALMAGSIAIDHVPATGAGCPPTDQRGTARPQGAACDSGAYEFIPPPPTITNISPNGGAMIGGTRVTITGTGFLLGATVTFGGVPATVLSVSDTAIVVTTPGNASGSVTVVVTNPGQPPGNNSGTLVNGFTYVIPPVITFSPTALPGGVKGVAYPATTLTASGGTAPYTYVVTTGTLPTGLTLTTAGLLSGIPTAGGTFPFTVTATDANAFTGTQQYTITVTAAPLTSITLAPPSGAGNPPTVKVGQSEPFTATGRYADGSTQTLTTQVQWASSNPQVATVDATGKVTGESPGTVTIMATLNGVTQTITVTVAGPTPIGITVQPAPAARPAGAASSVSPGAPPPAPVPTGR
ncbi:MAG: choice-of-anchor Q domain-containing protein [Thermomicrobiales bacterium]